MNRPWLAPVLAVIAAAGFVVAHVLADGARWGDVLLIVVPVVTATAAVVTAIRWQPVRPVPWGMLAAGFAVMAVSTLVRLDVLRDGDVRFPGDGDVIQLLAYPALFAGFIGLTSARRQSRDLLAGSEPIIYSIAVTALVWVAITGPHFDGDDVPLRSESWVWIFPLLDGLLAMLAIRRLSGHRGPHRYEILTLGMLVLGVGHAIRGWAAFDAEVGPGSWQMVAPTVGLLLVAAAVVLPDPVLRSRIDEAPRVHWTQIFGLLFASLVPLGALLLMLATGLASRSSSLVVSLATVAVVVLALARMWRLVDEVRTLSEQRGRDRLAAMVEHSSDVVMLADVTGRVNYVSPGLRAMLGYDPESWSGRELTDLMVGDEREMARRHLERVVEHGQGGTVEFEATLAHVDGKLRKAEIVIANLVGGVAVDGIVATIRDVTEQRNLERQLSHRAFHDELTGLANRALFLDRMDHALRISRSDVDPVVVLFVDLDDFKAVNDERGHATGDRVLKAVADRIRRAGGSGDTAARLGGDEFALLLEDRGGIDRAIDVAERLLDSMRRPIDAGDGEVTVLASVGVAVATAGMSTTSLLRDADIAMYEAKRAGKGQVRIFDPAMRLVATKHLEYRGDLAQAVERGQLRLVFMPYVDLANGQVIGAEALVRWEHPDHGDVPASEFVPIAERSGLIVPIGTWAIEQALSQAARWRAGLLVGINVSAVQLRQHDVVERVVELIDRYRVDPSTVVFELTESALTDDDHRVANAISRLRDEGLRVAIDDFGTGSVALTSLQRQPVDLLKVDRTAVEGLASDPNGPTIGRMILQTASSLGLKTVAEGIETTSQLRELRRLGCNFGQGFLLSRPVEASDIERRFGHPDAVTVG